MKKAVIAWKIQNDSNTNHLSPTLQQQIITEGNDAKQTVIEYCDWLTTTFNNSLPSENWRMPTADNHPSAQNPLEVSNSNEDYCNLVNTVERHTKCNAAYCLRKKNSQTQATCRFDYPRPLQEETSIHFEVLPSNRIRAKVITKRNDPLINTHNQTLLQHWRANVDVQVIIDIEDCVRYMTKYAAKAETKTQTAKKIFRTCVNRLSQTSQTKNAFRSAMIKSIGERDFSAQETAHMLLGLPLYSCTYSFVTISLDNSRSIAIHEISPCAEISTKLTTIDFYAKRLQVIECQHVAQMNLLTFSCHYYVQYNCLKTRKTEVIVRTFPCYSSNPEGTCYAQYCKYQLIKYKPWQTQLSNAWNDLPDKDENYIMAYHDFLKSTIAKEYLPQLAEELEHIEQYLEHNQSEDTNSDELHEQMHEQEEWMLLCQLNATFEQEPNTSEDSINWHSLITSVTEEQISESANWIYTIKKENPTLTYEYHSQIDANTLNAEQQLAYDIIIKHHKNAYNTQFETALHHSLKLTAVLQQLQE